MSRILLLVVLFACLACGRPSPVVLDPSGDVVSDARADYLFSDEEGRDWFLCGAPGFFFFSLDVSKVAKKLQLGGKISLVSKAEDQPGGS